jgi:hypothetical protein
VFGNTGDQQIELLQQLDVSESALSEWIKRVGYGLHHQSIVVEDFDLQRSAYKTLGYEEICFSDAGPNNFALFDTKGALPFILELVKVTKGLEDMYTAFRQAAVSWDGTDPVREFSAASLGQFKHLQQLR